MPIICRKLVNLFYYDFLQEESAFLAGCLACLITKTKVVGHLSGEKVLPGKLNFISLLNY